MNNYELDKTENAKSERKLNKMDNFELIDNLITESLGSKQNEYKRLMNSGDRLKSRVTGVMRTQDDLDRRDSAIGQLKTNNEKRARLASNMLKNNEQINAARRKKGLPPITHYYDDESKTFKTR